MIGSVTRSRKKTVKASKIFIKVVYSKAKYSLNLESNLKSVYRRVLDNLISKHDKILSGSYTFQKKFWNPISQFKTFTEELSLQPEVHDHPPQK